MQIQVHQVHAKITRADFPHQRIHVRTIHVKEPAFSVQDVRNLVDLLLKDPERVRIGKHQRCDFLIHLSCKRGAVHHSTGVRLQILNCIARHRGSRGIRAMCRIRNQDLCSRRTLRLVIRPHHQQAREFAMRARCRLQGNRLHARDLEQAIAQGFHDAQRALRGSLGLVRMSIGQPIKSRHHFIHSGVVLHRA